MNNPSPLRELTLARIRAFVREPEALFWTFGFPIMMALGLGIAFRERGAETAAVGIERGSVAERWAPFPASPAWSAATTARCSPSTSRTWRSRRSWSGSAPPAAS